MPRKGPTPTPIELSPRLRTLIESIVRRTTAPASMVERARIVLAATDPGMYNVDIAAELGLERHRVGVWRRRFLKALPRLLSSEQAQESDEQLMWMLESALSDLPRPGTPPTFSSEQLVQIVTVALEDPEDSGRPVTHWTPGELRDEVIKRGIVDTISTRHVGRFLKSGGPQTPSQRLLAQPHH